MEKSNKKSDAPNKEVIPFRQSLFWDVDPATIDPEKHAKYVIERMLDLGSLDELTWLFSYYPVAKVRHVLKTSRGVLHQKSKILWSLVLK